MIDSPLPGLLLLGLLLAAPMLLRRMRASAPQGLRVLGRTALHKNAVVAVVAVGERRLLLGAGERGVQLLLELESDAPADGTTTDPTTTTTASTTSLVDLTDGADRTHVDAGTGDALGALLERSGPTTTAGPGIGLVDRLRGMTVRTPQTGRPIRVPFRR